METGDNTYLLLVEKELAKSTQSLALIKANLNTTKMDYDIIHSMTFSAREFPQLTELNKELLKDLETTDEEFYLGIEHIEAFYVLCNAARKYLQTFREQESSIVIPVYEKKYGPLVESMISQIGEQIVEFVAMSTKISTTLEKKKDEGHFDERMQLAHGEIVTEEEELGGRETYQSHAIEF